MLAPESAYAREFRRGTRIPADADPFDLEPDLTPQLRTASAVLSVARALATPADAEKLLDDALAHWTGWTALLEAESSETPDVAIPAGPPALRLVCARLSLRSEPAAGFAALVAQSLTGRLAKHTRQATVAVLFDRGADGGSGLLRLSVHENGPAGLYPDPTSMTFLSTDRKFQVALANAWSHAPKSLEGKCVLWSLTDRGEPCLQVQHGSLGLAFGVLLDDLGRRMGRLGRIRLRRLGHRYAITGQLDRDGAVGRVSGDARKLAAAARERLRVLAPSACEEEFRSQPIAQSLQIRYVATLQEAIRHSRRFDPKATIAAAIAVALIIGVAGGGISALAKGALERQQAERRRIASNLAARSIGFEQADPRLAALLGLAAYKLDPSPDTVAAVLRILQRNNMIVQTIQAHPGGITAMTQDHTTKYAFTAGADRTVRVWDLASGRAIGTPHTTASAVQHMVHSPTTALMATVHEDNTIRLWRTDEPQRLQETAELSLGGRQATSGILTCGFYANGSRLFCLGKRATVWIWDALSRDLLSTSVVGAGDEISVASGTANIDFSHAGSTILMATGAQFDQRVLSYDLVNRQLTELTSRQQLPGRVTALGIQPGRGGDVIAVGTDAGLMLWNIATRQLVAYPAGGVSGRINHLQFGIGNYLYSDFLAVATNRGAYLLRAGRDNTGSGYGVTTTEPTGGPLELVATNPSGAIIAAATNDGSVILLDPGHHRLAQPPAYGTTAMDFGPSGDLLLAQMQQDYQTTMLYTIHPGDGPQPTSDDRFPPSYQMKRRFDIPREWASSSRVFAQDVDISGDWAAVAGRDDRGRGFVGLWDARTAQPRHFFHFSETSNGRSDIVSDVKVVPQRRLVLARHASGHVAAWSLDTGEQLYRVRLGQGSGYGLSISLSGDTALAAVVGDDPTPGQDQTGRLCLIDIATGGLTTVAVARPVFLAAYAPNGRSIAAAATNSTLGWYDGKHYKPIGDPVAPGAQVLDMAYSPDGGRLAAALDNGQTQIYDVALRVLAVPPLNTGTNDVANDVSWQPDGRLLAVSTATAPLREPNVVPESVDLWRVGDISWADQICGLVGRDITDEEWATYVGTEVKYQALCTGRFS